MTKKYQAQRRARSSSPNFLWTQRRAASRRRLFMVASALFSIRLVSARAIAQIFTTTARPESRNRGKVSFATVFIFLLCLGLTSQTALAQDWKSDWSKFPSGAETVCGNDNDIDNDDDGLIELCYLEDLNAVRNVLDGTSYQAPGSATTTTQGCADGGCKGYELVRDLDFGDEDSYRNATANMTKWTTGTGWLPIGNVDNLFSGIFEGNGHTLIGLIINTTNTIYIGLFGGISGVINGIGLLDGNVRGGTYVSSLAGSNIGGQISNSYNSGRVTGDRSVGGLVGLNNGGTIVNSYNSGLISDTPRYAGHSDRLFSGGLVGAIAGTISNSYNNGTIKGHSIGGLVGSFSGVTVSNSYNRGPISSTSLRPGSLAGEVQSGVNRVNNSYGIEEQNHAFIAATAVANLSITPNSGIKTAAELQAPTGSTGIYSAWSEDDWDFGTAIQYPAVKYTAGTNANYLACGTSQQPACGSLLAGQRTRLQIISTATDVRFGAVEGETVVLDATRTGDVTYEWKQIRGTDVSYLSTTDSAVLEFAVPFNVAAGSATATETLVFQLAVSDDSATTVSIVVYDDSDDGQITEPTVTRLSARGITVSVDLASDPDGAGVIEAYQWQICPDGEDCSPEGQWDTVSGTSTDSAYQIPDTEAMEGNQFRVQLTYRDGQNFQTTRNSTTLTYVPLSIADIAPIATTEGEVVTIVAEASVIFDGLSYVWRATTGTGDKTPSILEGSKVTSPTLMFTVPDNWANMAQTTLHLFVSVSDGETTSTNPVIVNITRIDNGRLTTPTIIERDMRLTVSVDLSSDPDGDSTIETYQWQLCRGSSATVVCDNEGSWMPAPGTPTTSSYMIQESDAVVGNQFRVQLTYRDGQNYPTTVTSKPLAYTGLRILDIDPIATTEGEVVEIVAMANVSAGDLSYVWHTTTGDKTPSILEDSTVTSSTLMFTVPNDWADTTQTALNLLVSVSDGETTATNPVIVNITRTDNGGLATIPTITEAERELTVSADLTTDPDGDGALEAYQWQLCRGSSATVVCDNEDSWMPAPGTSSTASSYTIQESDAVVGNQFRVQLTYRDGQGYSRTVISETLSYGQVKAIFIRLKLFLEGALQ